MVKFKPFLLPILMIFVLVSCHRNDLSELKRINLGEKLSKCISKLDIEPTNLQSIQEPPLISHGFSFRLKGGDIGYLIIERAPISPGSLINNNVYEQFKDQPVIGIAWRTINDAKGHVGVEPPRWKE